MKIMKKLVFVLCLVAFLSVAYGCEKEGPAEKAGKKMDQALDNAGDSLKEMGDKIKE
ncbi:hypothetical protein [Maridesulfovibrio ferrireducens]|uniref:hypothetical protein n=1 Tax=Maridesulfovibrio ferrireducens TaxID=246191 RepID=UPI001A1ED0DC|nr:hypothetical protein [Maridesulfovibrio ferrireducens]MBI9112736.1 hypothetical protein [Maridesulfovibrio ferrireducens]